MEATGNWIKRTAAALVRVPQVCFLRSVPLLTVLLFGCNPSKNNEVIITMNPAPVFNADSAFGFVAEQVKFGPRIPGTEAHRRCGDYLTGRLKGFGASVREQEDTVTAYDGSQLPMRNIIASFSLERAGRILLCAHWDTRPFADRDTARKDEPIDGANDGASGVGVLMEIARNLSVQSPSIGVDIILFDVEDQGRPAFETSPDPNEHFFCLGSRYWAKNRGKYTAQYGILLDMVGAENAVFTMEGVSMKYAEHVVRKVWDTGNQLGFPDYFRYNRTREMIDDHTYVNEIAGIPCIDILQFDSSSGTTFGSYWHTHADDMKVIDPATLKAVGQTVLQVIYNE